MSASRYAPELRLRSGRAVSPGVVSLDLEGACGELILCADGAVHLRAKAGSERSPMKPSGGIPCGFAVQSRDGAAAATASPSITTAREAGRGWTFVKTHSLYNSDR